MPVQIRSDHIHALFSQVYPQVSLKSSSLFRVSPRFLKFPQHASQVSLESVSQVLASLLISIGSGSYLRAVWERLRETQTWLNKSDLRATDMTCERLRATDMTWATYDLRAQLGYIPIYIYIYIYIYSFIPIFIYVYIYIYISGQHRRDRWHHGGHLRAQPPSREVKRTRSRNHEHRRRPRPAPIATPIAVTVAIIIAIAAATGVVAF